MNDGPQLASLALMVRHVNAPVIAGQSSWAVFGPELALLDPGEISTRLTTSNGAMVVLMLCQRGNELTKSTTEEAVGAQLRNQRVNAMAQAFIDEARANATIEILR